MASRTHGRDERRQEGYEEAEHRAEENPGPGKNRQSFQRGRSCGELQAAQHVQALEGVQGQVEVFERYCHSLCWALTGANYMMDGTGFRANIRTTAQDVADLIVLGSINTATVEYGVIQNDGDLEQRYWARRKAFFARGGRLAK